MLQVGPLSDETLEYGLLAILKRVKALAHRCTVEPFINLARRLPQIAEQCHPVIVSTF
jgi:hypothetical protein